jgi:hypothetical protein
MHARPAAKAQIIDPKFKNLNDHLSFLDFPLFYMADYAKPLGRTRHANSTNRQPLY